MTTAETVILLLLLAVAVVTATLLWRLRVSIAGNWSLGPDAQRARYREDLQSALSAQMGPLQTSVMQVHSEVGAAKAEQEAALLARFSELQDVTARALSDGIAEHSRQSVALRTTLEEGLARSRHEMATRLDAVQAQVQERLQGIQALNEQKLEQMRVTVDERLHQTLERRLGESFSLVAERLEEVQKGLGEMQTLAQDVGGLKRVLSNVKSRGVLGEAQLGALLEQFLSPAQYEANVRPKPRSSEIVEYAVKLPGVESGTHVWLPIDAKFPIEDYQRLLDAYDSGDRSALDTAGAALDARILSQGREIRDKYISVPHTTDFALMFLPFEGLYAEALRRPDLLGRVQRECRVTFVGPTTLTAFLNSLQVGFKTLAVTKQSAEVWKTLGKVKSEFVRFADALESVQKKISEASGKLDDVSKRRYQMERALARVESGEIAGEEEVPQLLGSEPGT